MPFFNCVKSWSDLASPSTSLTREVGLHGQMLLSLEYKQVYTFQFLWWSTCGSTKDVLQRSRVCWPVLGFVELRCTPSLNVAAESCIFWNFQHVKKNDDHWIVFFDVLCRFSRCRRNMTPDLRAYASSCGPKIRAIQGNVNVTNVKMIFATFAKHCH